VARVDAVDRKILRILQQDASATVSEIGRAVGLSSTPCWKRIQKLESSGVIRKRVALVEREKVGLGVTARVIIEAADHNPVATKAFIDAVRNMPEVLELHRLAGDIDFSLRIVAIDVRHYDAIYRRLTSLMPMRRVSSYFELEELKSETALPLGLALEVGPPVQAGLS
jgi:Lrp/AsnC family transcriptional regulator